MDFEYLLDRSHGADYFRRWHRRMENSGGLLVHKATHHFDMVNFWIGEVPEEVYANASLRFYGPTRKERGERCCNCAYRDTCGFAVDFQADPYLKAFYFDAEKEDGYFRDQCVFSEEIDIYDTMSVTCRYSQDTILTYSLIAYSPYEGWKVSISGTEGRLEAAEYHSGEKAAEPANHISIYQTNGDKTTYDVRKASGGHGGGDAKLQRLLFRAGPPDPLDRMAGSLEGARSILIGISANKSIREKRPVFVRDLLKG